MENLDSLARQAKNNINILSITPVTSDDGGATLSVSISYEFQYRPKAGAAPHWVKTCDMVEPGLITDQNWVRQYVVERVREARAKLEA